ncbi:Predicted arabinose efflux permease, MFS family [Ferrithrix thermotolerans DSM 19514]|uniref:Predicted arabinose efflux permease, MFS family n=1 Tax=Ferrithrix thermotolerans DSM 19514 TaxID=1121881 RepID=A0A1M4Y2U4_9ACTN|nr:MFS transporter [Ferrithrix thermotolerans]SHF00008.1 Predicted arabinose efflux permease, MFS family [Ferrithrix thermotolerans DSM 19514]
MSRAEDTYLKVPSKVERLIYGSIAGGDLRRVLLARALMSASRALAGVLVPVYLVLIGFSATSLGVLFMAIAFAAVVLSYLVGVFSDRVGAKPFLVLFPMIVAAASVVFAFTSNVFLLVPMAMLASYGRGAGAGAGQIGPYQPAESSLIASSVLAKDRNQAFARVSMFSTAGAFVGSLLALMSSSKHGSHAFVMLEFRGSMLLVGALALGAGLVVLPIANARPGKGSKSKEKIPLPHAARLLIARLWATNTLTGLSVGLYGPFITYWLYRRFAVSTATIGLLYAAVNVVALSSGIIAPKLAERYGLVRATVMLRVVQSVLLIPWALAPNFAFAGLFYAVRMIAQRASLPLRQSYALGQAPEGAKARVSSISNIPSQIAMAVSPAVAGVIYDSVSLDLPLVLGGILQLASTGLYYVFFKDRPPEEEQ